MQSQEGQAHGREGKVLASALVLGLLADRLLRISPWGANAAIWLALLALASWLFRPRDRAPARPGLILLLLTAVLFAAAAAGRASPVLLVANLVLSAICLLLAALKARGGDLALAGFTDYVFDLVYLGRDAALAPVDAILRAPWRNGLKSTEISDIALSVARGAAVGLPLIAVFAALFLLADEAFTNVALNALQIDLREPASHAAWIAGGTWAAGGLIWQFASAAPLPPAPAVEAPRGLRLGPIEVGLSLGGLDLLFLAFVVVQARYLFGGHGVVEQSLHLTYSHYARHGFYELLAVSVLALPVILLTDWLLDRRCPIARRTFRVVGMALIILLAAVMASALKRLAVLVNVYGLSELRLYALAGMAWLAVVFGALVFTVFRGRRSRFWPCAFVAAVAVIGLLNIANPDSLIARTNIARLENGNTFDVDYALELSDDAVPALIAGLPRLPPDQACRAATELLHRFSTRTKDARKWNYGRWHAERLAGERRDSFARFCTVPFRSGVTQLMATAEA